MPHCMPWNLTVFPFVMGYFDVCDIPLYAVNFVSFPFWHTFWNPARRCRCGVFRSLASPGGILLYPAWSSAAAFHLFLSPFFCLVIWLVLLLSGNFPSFSSTLPNRADSAARNGRNTFFTPPCLRRHWCHLQKSAFQLLASDSVTGAGLDFVQRIDVWFGRVK